MTQTDNPTSTLTASSVEGMLQYLSPPPKGQETKKNEVAAVYHASQAGTTTGATHEGQYSYTKVNIHNGRMRKSKSFSLDREGFELVPHAPSSISDFYNNDLVDEQYSKEIETFLKQHLTNVREVHVFDHTTRSSCSNIRSKQHMREPSSVIHNDYTENSAKKRLVDILGIDRVQEYVEQKRRFAIVNVWRSICGTVECWPMTMCDSTTVDFANDVVSIKRVAKDRIGEVQMAYANPNHQWYYFPNMIPEEVLLIKTFDSLGTNNENKKETTQFTIHTAFDDPTSPKNACPRQSIETRAFVLY